jgi:dTDP-glucose 4,6-dehydratase
MPTQSSFRKRMLITGSAGFILGNFIRRAHYTKQPYEIHSVDRVSFGSIHGSVYVNKDHQFHIGDITDAHIMDVLFDFVRPQIVLHGAASTHVDRSLKDPNAFIRDNVLGTQIIINACVKWGVEKLLFCSTDEVYGQLENENDPSWTEETPLNPRNPYSASKAAGELLVKAAHSSYGLNYNITRSANNYGPRQTADKLIPKTIRCILEDQKIPIYGQGLQMRDWLHVQDNCDGILTVLNKGAINQTYNIGANQELPNVEVVQRICNLMGNKHSLMDFIPDPRTGHDFRYALDCTKIKALGWKPEIKFNDGIIETIGWFEKNRWALQTD